MNYFNFIDWEIVYRLFLSLCLGAFIGTERSFFKKQAGIRTFALVSLGACLFAYLGVAIDSSSPSRVLSNLVVGIGFLGAGVIFLHEEKVIGLTTAASLWVTTAIGAAIGLGYYSEAFFSTIFSLLILTFLNYFERLIRKE
jgi:putative Mg2+ transporter-C (MgtC) family protein